MSTTPRLPGWPADWPFPATSLELQGDEIALWDHVLCITLTTISGKHSSWITIREAVEIADAAIVLRRERLPHGEPADGGGPYRGGRDG